MRALIILTALALCACDDAGDRDRDASTPVADATTAGADAHTVLDSGPDGTPLATDAAIGMSCGGKLATQCSGDQFCDFPDDICGAADGTGSCAQRPVGCPDIAAQPVCACDGNVYSLPCDANLAGFDLNALGGCATPQGTFACGPHFCSSASQYCQKTEGGAFGTPPGYSCQAIPAACPAQPTCACFAGEMCASLCTASGAGDFTLTCQFP